MLYTPVNHFNWSVDNWASTYPCHGTNSTLLTAGASAHVKGADAAVLSGIAEDCYGIYICVGSGSTSGVVRRQMIDFLIDPAAGVGNAGSTWSVAINNLFTNCPTLNVGRMGHEFYFPVFLKAGTAIGARTQDTVADATCRFGVGIFGKPTHPHLLKVGQVVQTLGATTASTSGVTVVPGASGVMGSYSATLGTLTRPAWWWQLGLGCADTSMTDSLYRWDIAHDATSKYICAQGIHYAVGSAEESAKAPYGLRPPIRNAPAGTDVYVRGIAGTASVDSSMSAVVYALCH